MTPICFINEEEEDATEFPKLCYDMGLLALKQVVYKSTNIDNRSLMMIHQKMDPLEIITMHSTKSVKEMTSCIDEGTITSVHSMGQDEWVLLENLIE